MSSILLSTLNARYSHCSFGLRYLFANLKELKSDSEILEFTISQNPRDIVEQILLRKPQLLGLGVYIWNTKQTYEVVSLLKSIQPDLRIILGGPEVSYETNSQPICQLADLTIQGEADFLFYEICSSYFKKSIWPKQKWISGELPSLKEINLPYEYYSQTDIQNRVIYVEASRGCPYKCEYCLSSLDKSVRSFDLHLFLMHMDLLIQRGVRRFKFVDRTFNLSISTSIQILTFFLERISLGLFLHFEMVPDRLPTELKHLIQKFPQGTLQFEIGIQTWNPEVSKRVSRRQDYLKITENFLFLTQSTGVHTHADLIVGLPGETLESFAQGFDAVAKLNPSEIQIGMLKRLKGTPIHRHDQEWQMVYQEHSPFQVIKTRTLSFEQLQKLERFSNFWNLIANSGHFIETLKLIVQLSNLREQPSLFWEFNELSTFLHTRHPQSHSIALLNLLESLWIYFKDIRFFDIETLREAFIQDYTGKIKRDIPSFLRKNDEKFQKLRLNVRKSDSWEKATPKRQRNHLRNSVPC